MDAHLAVRRIQGASFLRKDLPFAHGALYTLADGGPPILCCYHPSRQNTQTGRLTRDMLMGVLRSASEIVSGA